MKRVLRFVAGLAAAALVLAAVAVALASVAWNQGTEDVRAQLRESEIGALGVSSPADPSVPAPVARYLARAVPDPGARIRFAEVVHEGTFQMGEGDEGWRPFRSVQLFRAYPPGFVWDASIGMAPLLTVRVRDGYVGGAGTMKGAVAALITMVDAPSTPELAEGALYRYLAEAAWFPTRLLPGAGLTWAAEDDSTAWATLEDRGNTVTLRFRFSPEGDITGVMAPDRLREEDGAYTPAPWVGRFHEHATVEGFRVPVSGEVSWVMDGVEVPYWRGRVVEARYEIGR